MDWMNQLSWVLDVIHIRLFEIGNTPVTVATLAILMVIITASYFISRFLQRGLRTGFRIRGITDTGSIEVANRLLHYLIMLVGTGIALQTIGINLSTLFAAGAVFAIVMGFAMQNIAQNFVSGVILLLERSIKPGDILMVEGRLVKVRKMGIRATIARTLDEEEIIVPNAAIVQSTVTNYTLRDSLYRLRSTVGVTYDSDMDLVKRTLQKIAEDITWRHQKMEPLVFLTEFGDSSVNFEVSIWMEDPWKIRRARSEVNEAIWWAFRKAGIVIAFPQLDIHLDPPVMESLQSLKKAV